MTRKMDKLGRLSIPIELRENLGFNENDIFEIIIEGSDIIFRKKEIQCIFCGEQEDLKKYREKAVCGKCAADIYTKQKEQ